MCHYQPFWFVFFLSKRWLSFLNFFIFHKNTVIRNRVWAMRCFIFLSVWRTCLSIYVVIRYIYLLLCSGCETWTYECHAHVTYKSKTNTNILAYGRKRHNHTHTHVRTNIRKKYYYTEKQELCGTNATAKTIQPNSMEFRLKCLNYGNVFVSIPIE